MRTELLRSRSVRNSRRDRKRPWEGLWQVEYRCILTGGLTSDLFHTTSAAVELVGHFIT